MKLYHLLHLSALLVSSPLVCAISPQVTVADIALDIEEKSDHSSSSCKCPQAPEGPRGNTGPQGRTGTIGIAGDVGPDGPQGPSGTPGPTGPAIGPTGPTGPVGPNGASGATGATGPSGVSGATGPSGVQGPSGPSGPTGPSGAQGGQGGIGRTGSIGHIGATGASTIMYHFGGHLGGSGLFLCESDMETTISPNTANINGITYTAVSGGAQPVLSSGNSVSGHVGIVSFQNITSVTYTLTLVGLNNDFTQKFSVGLGSFNDPSGSGAQIYNIPNTSLGNTLGPGEGMGIIVTISTGNANNEEIQVNLTLN